MRKPGLSLERLCRWFGISRQAFYQHYRKESDSILEERFVLFLVKQIRRNHSRMGVRKLHYLLKSKLEEGNVKIGRDRLYDILRTHKLLIRKRARSTVTTNSRHWYRKYTNLIRELELTKPNQLWVSDITYIPQEKGFLYLSLITDAYSHKIVGFQIAPSMEAIHTIKALQMALYNSTGSLEGLIHHSDRGIQYCSHEYVKLLSERNIQISMTEKSDPLENAIAERVNGILKQEYLENKIIRSQEELNQIIYYYNEERPHLSCNMLTPSEAHLTEGQPKRKWTKKYQRDNFVNQ